MKVDVRNGLKKPITKIYSSNIDQLVDEDTLYLSNFIKKLDNLVEYYKARNQCIESRKLIISLSLLRDNKSIDTDKNIERYLVGLTEPMKKDVRTGLRETFEETRTKIVGIKNPSSRAVPASAKASSVPASSTASIYKGPTVPIIIRRGDTGPAVTGPLRVIPTASQVVPSRPEPEQRAADAAFKRLEAQKNTTLGRALAKIKEGQ
jgi:hypothetical protein